MVSCSRCGRTLTNLISIAAGMGPICRGKTDLVELRAEAKILAESQPIDLKTEVEIYKALNKHNVSISGAMSTTFGKKEKQWEKAGWIWVREYSIHFPERLEQALEEFSQTHLLNAIVYDIVENGSSRLIVNLWRFPLKNSSGSFNHSQTRAEITGIKDKPAKQTFSQYLNSTLDQFIGGN